MTSAFLDPDALASTLKYLFAIQRFQPGATLRDALQAVKDGTQNVITASSGDPDWSPQKLREDLEELIKVYETDTLAAEFGMLAFRESHSAVLLQANLGRLLVGPPVRMEDEADVHHILESPHVTAGDLAVLQIWFDQSPATSTRAANCLSSDGRVLMPVNIMYQYPLEPFGLVPNDHVSVGGYLIFLQARSPGKAVVISRFLRAVGWRTATFEVTVQ